MLDPVVQFIEQSGGWMYLLAPLFMVAVAILPFPAEIPAMLNGMIFGSALGMAITWSGAVVGAVASFELARRYGRPLSQRWLSADALARADHVVLSAGWPALLTARLIPTIAFTLLNWAAGLTPIRRWTFLWTTAVGIVPGVLIFTLSGSGLAAFYRRHPTATVIVAALALLVLALATHRYRQRASRTETASL